MSESIIGALIGATSGIIVAALGWFFAWRQGDKSRRQDAERQYLERQIEELYGPLSGYIAYSKIITNMFNTLLHTSTDGKPQFRDNDGVDVARFFEENYMFPVNDRIRGLIASKIHLLATAEIPSSFLDFLQYAAEYECLYKLWKETEIETNTDKFGYKRMQWPINFEQDVHDTLSQLRKEHQKFLEKTGLKGRRPNIV